MKYQNYMTQLKAKHPEEDSKNLRGKSDKSIKSMFQLKGAPATKRTSSNVGDLDLDSSPKRHLSTLASEVLDINQNKAGTSSRAPSVHGDDVEASNIIQQGCTKLFPDS